MSGDIKIKKFRRRAGTDKERAAPGLRGAAEETGEFQRKARGIASVVKPHDFSSGVEQ